MSQFTLTGRTALVTGASRGIGKAMAVALAQAGADIIGVSARLNPSDSEVARLVAAAGREFRAYACDFADRSALRSLIATLNKEAPGVDILVNNAGTIGRAPAAQQSDELWDRIIEINLSAHFVLTRELGGRMVDRRFGKVIFVASLLSFQGGISVASYAASKGGLAQLTKALANEWAPHGVNVNAIAPGYVRTDNTAALQADADRSRQILERIPAGRWALPEDFSGPAVFLASPASDYINGHVLVVDGGWLAR
jgi:2-dehydro-3-deoxy-D-gluconate 5-dehydrogenase